MSYLFFHILTQLVKLVNFLWFYYCKLFGKWYNIVLNIVSNKKFSIRKPEGFYGHRQENQGAAASERADAR